jgi:hypothetical protein
VPSAISTAKAVVSDSVGWAWMVRAMSLISQPISIDLSSIKVDDNWSYTKKKEKKIHKIHVYPAKFPSFITGKAISYAQSKEGIIFSLRKCK